jgi:hypothetical protein
MSATVIASKMYVSLLTDLKAANKLLKAKVKKGMRDDAVDIDERAADLLRQLAALRHVPSLTSATLLSDDAVRGVRVLPGLSVGYIADALTTPSDLACFKQHVATLTTLAQAPPDGVEATLKAIQSAQLGEAVDDGFALLRECYAAPLPSPASAPGGLEGLFANTRIGDIAKEIAGEIDVSALASNPDAFSLQGLMGSNSPIAGIVSTVGSKIQSKIASGELKQEELLSEAMGMLKFVSPEMLSMFASVAAPAPAPHANK